MVISLKNRQPREESKETDLIVNYMADGQSAIVQHYKIRRVTVMSLARNYY